MLTMCIFPSFIYYIALYNFIIALTFPKLHTYTHEMHILKKYIYTYPIVISKIIFTMLSLYVLPPLQKSSNQQ
jgi:hypothetical protein